MKIINLTPHNIIVNNYNFPPSGTVARCEEITEKNVSLMTEGGESFQLVKKYYGKVENLPEIETYKEHPLSNYNHIAVYYIVSAMVRLAVPDRQDLLSPGDLIRDEKGNIVGCKNLVCN
jgi:hypothetical protein